MNASIYPLLLLIPAVPLFMALLLGILHLLGVRGGWKMDEDIVAAFAVIPMLLVTALATRVLWLDHLHSPAAPLALSWLPLGGNLPPLALFVRVDALSAIMLVLVTLISTLVQLYSAGYMHGDEGFARYFSFINFFTFAMLGLVLVDDLLGAYVFWELVGLGSYLLIGFWYRKPEAVAANKKAFVVNRVGDFGFLLGILLLYATFHTLSFDGLETALAHLGQAAGPFGMSAVAALGIAMVLVTWGPIGKSAQFPLHVWLPDAMEGPTPVSALIHAATMVAAGVYLVARCMFLYAAAPAYASHFVAVIGGFTALFAATIAIAQWDIKRILAYSTVSQLGYMMLALGLGPIGLVAGIFHLVNHAFFKALLFLGSGSIIHSTGTQDIREMGGLRKAMPVTFAVFTLATLSIVGFPLLSGFWSKDAILALTFQHDLPLYVMGSVAAVLTAFYMFRLWFYAFTGTYRGGRSHPSRQEWMPADHLHESPWTMTLPMVILAVPSVLFGFTGVGAGGGAFGRFLLAGLAHAPAFPPAHEGNELRVMAISTVLALLGIALAWAAYSVPREVDVLESALGPVWDLLSRKWLVDDLYGGLVDRVSMPLARLCAFFDRYVINGVVNLVGLANVAGAEGFRLFQTGRAQGGVWAAASALTLMGALFAIFGFGR